MANRWTKEETQKAISLLEQGKTFSEIGENINKATKAVRVKMNKKGYKYRDYHAVIKETIICKHCQNIFVALKRHNRIYCSHTCAARYSNTHRISKKNNTKCKQCNKSLRNLKGQIYCNRTCMSLGFQITSTLLPYSAPSTIRKYLLKNRKYKCESCKQTKWMKQPIPLEVDHIDGNHKNNKEENLRLLCTNCHALTPTYRNKNRGNGRVSRRKKH